MKKKIVLVCLHKEPEEGINQYTLSIYDALKRSDNFLNIDIVKSFYSNLDLFNPEINVNPYNAIVLSGSDYVHSHKSYFLKKLIKNIVEDAKNKKIKILGVCSGIQTLGIVFGYKVERMKNPEVGWYNMELTELGEKDPLFKDIPKNFEGFSTHTKSVNLNGKTDNILVKNKNCIQAVKYYNDPAIYGLQFHPDDTFESARKYLEEYDKEKKGEPTLADMVNEPFTVYGEIIFKNFINMS